MHATLTYTNNETLPRVGQHRLTQANEPKEDRRNETDQPSDSASFRTARTSRSRCINTWASSAGTPTLT